MTGKTISFSMTRRGRTFLTRVPFEKLARASLPPRYSLSLVLCDDSLARTLGRKYLQKKMRAGYAPNVLSFPLEKKEGEIFLNLAKAKREAKELGIAPSDRAAHLLVHGCLHLRGIPHGKTMDASEDRILRRFKFKKSEDVHRPSKKHPQR